MADATQVIDSSVNRLAQGDCLRQIRGIFQISRGYVDRLRTSLGKRRNLWSVIKDKA
jgi:hypothetical protein